MELNLNEYDIPEKLREWRSKQEVTQKAHVGTHIDTYRETSPGISPTDIRAVVVDARGLPEIGIDSIEGREIQEGDFVIFRTGYMEGFGYGADGYFDLKEAPELKDCLVDKLIEKKVRFIGIDLHGIQHKEKHKKIDIYCEERGVYVVENLQNLDKLDKGEVMLRVAWEQVKGGTAISVKIELLEE